MMSFLSWISHGVTFNVRDCGFLINIRMLSTLYGGLLLIIDIHTCYGDNGVHILIKLNESNEST
jgi:hypothetical protein